MNTATKQSNNSSTTSNEDPWSIVHGEVPSESTENFKGKAADSLHKANSLIKENAVQLKETASESLSEAQEAVKANYSKATDLAAESYSEAKTIVKSNFEKHPLAFLAGAVATGVAIGMALPNTKKEGSILKKPANSVREGAAEAKSKIAKAAEAAKATAIQTLEDNNLDPESLKETAKEVGNRSAESATKVVKH